jgi:hypothetical protein
MTSGRRRFTFLGTTGATVDISAGIYHQLGLRRASIDMPARWKTARGMNQLNVFHTLFDLFLKKTLTPSIPWSEPSAFQPVDQRGFL